MNSPFGWPGGKQALKKVLLELIPKHQAYVEVFCGSAKLLFAKPPSHWEIINDTNDDLLNFFRVVKHRPAELTELIERDFIGAARFRELRAEVVQPVDNAQDELHRALRFIYLVWWSFGSKGEHFAGHTIQQLNKQPAPVRRLRVNVRELLDATSVRLYAVLVDRRDFADCIARYDSRQTFFYLDPPYTSFGGNGRYDPLPEERIRELFKILRRIRGKFLLSFDDAPIVRGLARGFCLRPVSVLYSLAAKGNTTASELLIANYPLTPQNRSNSQNPHDAHKRNRNSATRSYSPQHVTKIKSDSATQEL